MGNYHVVDGTVRLIDDELVWVTTSRGNDCSFLLKNASSCVIPGHRVSYVENGDRDDDEGLVKLVNHSTGYVHLGKLISEPARSPFFNAFAMFAVTLGWLPIVNWIMGMIMGRAYLKKGKGKAALWGFLAFVVALVGAASAHSIPGLLKGMSCSSLALDCARGSSRGAGKGLPTIVFMLAPGIGMFFGYLVDEFQTAARRAEAQAAADKLLPQAA